MEHTVILALLVFTTSLTVTLVLFFHLTCHTKRVFEVIRDSIWYFYYSANYSLKIVVYAFCNIDDLSWGSKGQVLFFRT